MDHAAVLSLFDRQMRREARPDGPAARVEREDGVVRQVGPADGWNGVLWSGLDASGADAAIAREMRRFRCLGREFEWKVYGHDEPADLPARLLAAGFVPGPREALLVAETAALALDVPLPDGVELRPVTDASGVELVARVHEAAFGRSSPLVRHQLLTRLAHDPAAVPAVVALAGGIPVSAARVELCPGTDFAGLWGGGTVPGWRGRGVYRALVAFRARLAAAHGYRYLQVDASDLSRPVLRRLGFASLGTTTPYVMGAPAADGGGAVALSPVS